MAGLERNPTRESIVEAIRDVLDTHPEVGTLKQAAAVLDISDRTLGRHRRKFGLDKTTLGVALGIDWKAREASANAVARLAVQPCRWTFGLVITASTFEEAVARFRTEISPSVEIESVQKH